MCVMSMIMDWKSAEWDKRYNPPNTFYEFPKLPTTQEIQEFRDLLDRAREYDKKHNEPDCELEEKKEKIRQLAKELNVNVDFIDDPVVSK